MGMNETTGDSSSQSKQKTLYEAYPHMRFTICRDTTEESYVIEHWTRRLWAYFRRKR